jgi:hypothetical protein
MAVNPRNRCGDRNDLPTAESGLASRLRGSLRRYSKAYIFHVIRDAGERLNYVRYGPNFHPLDS